ncbi:MAG: hypothetical protein ABUL50_08335, partial [Rhizobacter sp.]
PASRIVFSGVGKTRAEMKRALEAGVLCFNVESEAELEVLSQVAAANGRTARVSLRINPDVDAGTHPYISTGLKGNKFGIAHERALECYVQAVALPGLEVIGIDCHIGSQITDTGPYLDALDRLLDLVEAIEARGIKIHHLDLGGGLGITYTDEAPPSAEVLVKSLLARIDARGHGHRKVMFEPGRSLVGNAGVLVSAVLSAGAYGMSMASNYNTRGRAAEVMVSGDQAWLIREREQVADLIRGEHLLPAA